MEKYTRKKYNIHDKFKFMMAGNVDKYASNEWSYYKDDSIDKLNLIVYCLPGKVPDPWKMSEVVPMEVVGMKAWISLNSIIFNNSHKFASWKAYCSYINRVNQPPEVYFEPGLFGWWYLRENLIEPYMRYFLAEYQDTFLLHAGSLSINGKGVLFPSFGATGKTVTVLNLATELDEDINFMSEDCGLVTGDGKILNYPHVLRTFYFSTENVGPFYKSLSKKDKFALKKNKLIRKAVMNIATPPHDFVDLDKLFKGRIQKEAKLDHVFFLRKTNQKEVFCDEYADKDRVRCHMLESLRQEIFEHDNFDPYFMFSTYNPMPMVKNYWTNVHKGLDKILKNTNVHEIYIPAKYDKEAYDNVKKSVLEVVG